MSTLQSPSLTVILAAAAALGAAGPAPAEAPDTSPARPLQVYGGWQTFTVDDGLPNDRILALCSANGRLWVGTEGGLACFEDGTWTAWTASEDLPWPAVSAIACDPRTRDLWLGTWGGGIIRLTAGRFDHFDQLNSGLAGNLVFSVAIDGDVIWAATNAGLSAYDVDQDRWDLYFERRADAPETAITGLCLDDGRLWAAAWCGGLWVRDTHGDRWQRLAEPAPRPDADTTQAAAVSDGRIWWAQYGELLRQDPGGRWTARRFAAPGAEEGLVNCIAVSDEGTVYLGTECGLRVPVDWASGMWVTYRGSASTPDAVVTVDQGDETLEARLPNPGLPDDRVRCVAFHDGGLWVGTAAGLARAVTREPLDDLRPAPSEGGARARAAPGPPPYETLRIGALKPGERMIDVPGSPSGKTGRLRWVDTMAMNLAIEQANDKGGYRGRIPFSLASGPQGWFMGWGWTTAEDNFPELSYLPDVMGIVAYIGPGSHLTTAVALRTGLPVVNFAPTTATVDETIDPWIFRCPGHESERLEPVLDFLFDDLGRTRLGVLRDSGHPSAAALDWWISEAAARGHRVVADRWCDAADDPLGPALEALRDSGAEAVLTWTDAERSARILRAMRDAGMTQVFVGGYDITGDAFVTLAGPRPGLVVAPRPPAGEGEANAEARFVEDYMERFRRPPTPGAFRTFEATRLLLEAINAGGADRDAVRRALRELSRDDAGATGGNRPAVGRLEEGKWQFSPLSDSGPAAP